MEEILCSFHNYTKFSGYPYSFYDMSQQALDCGLDAVITTDKNIYPTGHDQYYYRSGKKLLVVCGEELFDPLSEDSPRYISLGVDREQFNKEIGNPREEIRIPRNISAENNNFRHFELINSEELLIQGLNQSLQNIRKNFIEFDNLLLSSQRCVCLAGTRSSSLTSKHTCAELFSTAYNHILTEEGFTGDLIHDKLLLLKSIKNGNLFLALDGLADAKGFRFSAEGNNRDSIALPGDMIHLQNSITLKIRTPESCTCRLIHNGKTIKEWRECKQIPFVIYEPGYYRVECALTIRRNIYDWIFSNPIYVRKG